MRLLKTRLQGLAIEEDLEPSDALIDKFNAMKEEVNLRFIAWDELTRRDEEIRSVKKNKIFETDSQGRLKVAKNLKKSQPTLARTSNSNRHSRGEEWQWR